MNYINLLVLNWNLISNIYPYIDEIEQSTRKHAIASWFWFYYACYKPRKRNTYAVVISGPLSYLLLLTCVVYIHCNTQ